MHIRSILFAFASLLPLWSAEDPRQIVRRALDINARNEELERSYTYVQRDEVRYLDHKGAVSKRESRTWDVIPLKDSHFRRLIQRDDHALSAKEEKEQQAAQRKSEEARAKETPEQLAKRNSAKEKDRKREQEELDDIVAGFDFRLLGEEEVDGVPVWAIEGTPRPGYKFKTSSMLGKMKGRIWVARSDYQPVRIDAETTATIAIKGILARISKGTRIQVEFTHVNNEVWLPKKARFTASGRILLVKGLNVDGDSTFSNYKKFTAESRVVHTDQYD